MTIRPPRQGFKYNDPDDRIGDPERLRRVRDSRINDAAERSMLDRWTRIAAQITGADAAAVTLLEPGRQILASEHRSVTPPVLARQTPLTHSLCQYVVINDTPLVVPDVREHPSLGHHPAVEEHGIEAYAGYPLRDPDGHVLAVFCLLKSTPYAWTEAQLEVMADLCAGVESYLALRLQTRLHTGFLATAAHELRTPLTSIFGYTDLLTDCAAGELNPEQLTMVRGVERNSERLLNIVEDVLDLSGLVARTSESVPRLVDGNSVAANAWARLQPELGVRVLRAELELAEGSPLIHVDTAQVERALLHLLQNAVKFTPDGGQLRLAVHASPHDLEFAISDTGIGVPDADVALLFDPFFRTARAQALAIPGIGTGLAIVRQIVDAHQGRIEVASRIGGGTTFTVALPVARLKESHDAEPPYDPVEPPRAPTSVGTNLEADLRRALGGSVTQFVVHYQPIVNLTTGKVVEVESLVRWQHPVLGLLGAGRFIALAEATGLIRPLGDWVLEQAVRDASTLTHHGREIDVSVNLSPQQLDDHTVIKVRQALRRHGLRPERLILDVTESAFIHDGVSTAGVYQALSGLDAKIAVDNFGTGYSSLPHLSRHPISALKIDRRFVAGIGERPDDEAICQSIVSLGTAVGAYTVGAGVETTTQYAVLRSLGCHRGQGLLWSPAVPISELKAAFAACDLVPVATRRERTPKQRHELPSEFGTTITEMHAQGASLHTIAAALNSTIGRHPQGQRWTAGSVERELQAAVNALRARSTC